MLMLAHTRPLRHIISAAALQDYLVCPQQYAYRWLYEVPDHPRTPQQWFQRVIRRTTLTIVREILEAKTPTLSKVWLLLEMHSRGTIVRTNAKLAQRARTLIGQFNESMRRFHVTSLGETRLVTIPFSKDRASDVQIQADFSGLWKHRRTHILLTPPARPVESYIAGQDAQYWATMSVGSQSVGRVTKIRPTTDTTEIVPLIWQGLRGLARTIVWPYRDQRCSECVYAEGCTPADAHPQRLRMAKERRKVKNRMSKTHREKS